MKTINKITLKAAALAIVCLVAVPAANAQQYGRNMYGNETYLNVDWQLNAPISNDFASKISGWGMNFEGGWYIEDSAFGLGAFVAFHTNNESVSTRTIDLDQTSRVTLGQEHSLFQLPFGAGARYRFTDGSGVADPYLGLKIGANYARMRSFYSAYESSEDSWGFYLSPEVGVTIYPGASHYIGIHVSAYYSYASNHADLIIYSEKSFNNFGLRVGMGF